MDCRRSMGWVDDLELWACQECGATEPDEHSSTPMPATPVLSGPALARAALAASIGWKPPRKSKRTTT